MNVEPNQANVGSNKPRILFIIHSLERGGAETQLSYLASGLRRSGWDVHVLCQAATTLTGANEARLLSSDVPIHHLPDASNSDPRTILHIRRSIREIDPSIVQTWLTRMDFMGGAAARLEGVPWILSERNAVPPDTGSIKSILVRWLARKAVAIVANSEAGISMWSEPVSTGRRKYVVRNALPLEELARIEAANPEAAGVPGSRPLVVFAGRLNQQKNIGKLLEALDTATERAGACALLFGSGELECRAQDFIRDRAADDRIRLMGFRGDVWNWIKRADVFVSVSSWEGMPNTVMEAMALHCPVVVSRIDQHTEILDEGCATFVPTDDAEAISNGIVATIEDRAEAAARAERAFSRATEWSVDAAVEAYAAIYHEVDSTSSAGRSE